ncbi:MAG: hypothetical protein ACXITV_08300 [Luteibaculaceae bacterium]
MVSKEYPAKILLAFEQAIRGKTQFTEWLLKNGYPELGMTVYGIYNKQKARDWLMENKFPHWMAVINGAEGNENAQKWLLNFGFDVLYHVSRVGDGWLDSRDWLLQKGQKEFFMIAMAIRDVKNYIDLKNSDPHRFGQDG